MALYDARGGKTQRPTNQTPEIDQQRFDRFLMDHGTPRGNADTKAGFSCWKVRGSGLGREIRVDCGPRVQSRVSDEEDGRRARGG